MAPAKPDKKLAEAVLRLAARGWKSVTPEAVAKAAKIKKQFTDKNDFLPLVVDYVSAESFAASGTPSAASPMHDKIFDLLMARFDVLQKHRKAILSIMEAVPADPKTALILARAECEAMKKTLYLVGAGKNKPVTLLHAIGLLAVFAGALHVWRTDETIDMSKTMAALDRLLRYAGHAAIFLRLDFA